MCVCMSVICCIFFFFCILSFAYYCFCIVVLEVSFGLIFSLILPHTSFFKYFSFECKLLLFLLFFYSTKFLCISIVKVCVCVCVGVCVSERTEEVVVKISWVLLRSFLIVNSLFVLEKKKKCVCICFKRVYNTDLKELERERIVRAYFYVG